VTLLLLLFYGAVLSAPLGRLRRKRLPEGAFTVLGGTPLQLAANLTMIVLFGGFLWYMLWRQELVNSLFRRAFDHVAPLVPLGAAGAWALFVFGSVALWFIIEQRFRRFDPGSCIRLQSR